MAVLILVAVVLIVVMFMFYSSSHSAANQQATVQFQLTSARASLTVAQGKYDVAKLQAEQASLTYSPSFPNSFPNVALSSFLAGAADKFGVTITVLTPQSPAGTETLGGTNYFRYDTAVQVSGTSDAMNSFLSYLEEGPFQTLRIQNASFTPSGGTFTVSILTLS
ncbi:MAG TPA: hypothetical protein VEG28_03750 [Dehalococcoidia bacterium]|nr:hypothetical protein [Dehalococcoidia bacterium]